MVEYVGTSHLRTRARSDADAGTLLRRLDWVLLGGVAAAVAYGLWAIEGITRNDIPNDPSHYVVRQSIFAAIGAAGLIAALFVNPDVYRRYKRAIYLGTVGTMIFILVAGAAARGSTRWIDVGFFRFQPSEFGKLLFVLCIGGLLADRGRRAGEWRTVFEALGFAAVPIVLVFLQPDLGTALVYGAALAAVLYLAGTRWWQLAVLALVALAAAVAILWALPAAGIQVLKPYQQLRLTGFTNPDSDPRGATYHVHQSVLAVGAGGLTGQGVSGATQTSLDFLPEHATDFAFASLAEQRGFLGASILLLLYLLVVWRGLKVITVARDAFSAIVAAGIVVALLFQIFVNIGMTIGIAPITGIPLPFVSVGGSSMIANLLAIGVLEAIHLRGTNARRTGRRPAVR
ncbi:MAG: rod shape-determining protein RodA [Gaiellaceae bacterium]